MMTHLNSKQPDFSHCSSVLNQEGGDAVPRFFWPQFKIQSIQMSDYVCFKT